MNKLTGIVLCTLMLAACQQSDTASTDGMPSADSPLAPATTAAMDQPEQAPPPMSADQLFARQLSQVLGGHWRSDKNRARDKYRHPQKTLAFFKVQPDMTVIEITPGGGWYAEVLAPWLVDEGRYIAAVMKPVKHGSEAAQNETALQKLFAAHPQQFGKAEVVSFDRHAPLLGSPDSADRVLTFRNVHNWVMGDYAPGMFKAFFNVLKPGGVLGVVDHRASNSADPDKTKGSGYLPLSVVIKLATDAGFKLDAESEINVNPKDNHDHPKGVWSLPPTLVLGDKDKAVYQAIGESDRMTLRFIKPKGDKIKSVGMDSAPAQSQ